MARTAIKTEPQVRREREDVISTRPFPTQLTYYRERVGMSQSRLATLMNIDHSYVSRMESGRRSPSKETADRLATILCRPEERDSFLVAAGFAPKTYVHPNQYPEISSIINFLEHPLTSDDHKRAIRQLLFGVSNAARAMVEGSTLERISGNQQEELASSTVESLLSDS